MIKRKSVILWFMLLLNLAGQFAFSDVIHQYHVAITVLEDGRIDVLETIELETNHDTVKLGITREIPTIYHWMSQSLASPVDVLSVTREGQVENFWVENQGDFVEIFTGSVDNIVDNYLDKGFHTFVFHWQSVNHIRSFTDYDELYINAIGNNWRLPIKQASATIHLPKSVSAIQSAVYYGYEGDVLRGKVVEKSPQEIEFIAPMPIGNGQGMTIATGFTKGVLPSISPTWYDALMSEALSYLPKFMHPVNVIVFIVLCVLSLYGGIVALFRSFLQPKSRRAFMVRFSPPDIPLDLAHALYADNESDTNKAILALFIQLNSMEIITIDVQHKHFVVNPNAFERNQKLFSEAEQKCIADLIALNQSPISFGVYNVELASIVQQLRAHISRLQASCHETKKPIALIFGFILIGLMGLASSVYLPVEIYFSLLFIVFPILVIVYPTVKQFYHALREDGLISGIKVLFKRSLLIILAIGFGAVPLFAMLNEMTSTRISYLDYSLSYGVLWLTLLLLVIVIFTLSKGRYILKAQYLEQRQSLLEFRHFLSYTKASEYQMITADMFDEYLPYSIIFGVEKRWLKHYQDLYPMQYKESVLRGNIYLSQGGALGAFGHSMSAPATKSVSSSRSSSHGSYSDGGSGSGGGGSSGGGSGGGGGGGR